MGWLVQWSPQSQRQGWGRWALWLALCHWWWAADPELLGWAWPQRAQRRSGQVQTRGLMSALSLEPCSITVKKTWFNMKQSLNINYLGCRIANNMQNVFPSALQEIHGQGMDKPICTLFLKQTRLSLFFFTQSLTHHSSLSDNNNILAIVGRMSYQYYLNKSQTKTLLWQSATQ